VKQQQLEDEKDPDNADLVEVHENPQDLPTPFRTEKAKAKSLTPPNLQKRLRSAVVKQSKYIVHLESRQREIIFSLNPTLGQPSLVPLTKAIKKEPKPAQVSSFGTKRTLKISGQRASRPGAAQDLDSAAKQVSIVKLE
jgi:hypothetical protein